ncbi:uncharacterized protein K452DRAFT_102434 [Aplosporella prunicola CBS 121167]|uniref:Heterokaryon incompatibility domain-containing protein n=1 Tax=Aplosporella prunicola CBS 121167 TaxID=1176127 RepID=A0A6A6BP08_9PEZI|nr:uncharacterized protein K452DRAFT_102434 [Aplosporella prunicola CBS 121167]KAF2145870.1 hypothetical protein K452DRAFT_102434 [Aplosporella prunicola CBS 121167]
MGSQNNYEYSPFENRRDIRLLKITKDPPSFDLVHANLDALPPYETLSYTWGAPAQTHNLPLGPNGGIIGLTCSLRQALPLVSSAMQTDFIWIDQICINQNDIQERGQQVALMDDIYRLAERAIIWLGPEDAETHLAFELIRTATTHYQEYWAKSKQTLDDGVFPMTRCFAPLFAPGGKLGDAKRDARRLALYRLLQRPWFSRGWVVQELVLSKAVAVRVGGYLMSWEHLIQAFLAVYSTRQAVENISLPQGFGIQMALRTDYNEKTQSGAGFGWFDLCRLMANTAVAVSTTDPKDRVFAYLGFWKPSDFLPDYTQTVEQVYLEFAHQIMQTSDSLDILSLGHGTSVSPTEGLADLPSWAPDWSSGRGYYSLLLNNTNAVAWDAAKARQHAADAATATGSRTLHARGKIIDVVRAVSAKPFKKFAFGNQDLGEKSCLGDVIQQKPLDSPLKHTTRLDVMRMLSAAARCGQKPRRDDPVELLAFYDAHCSHLLDGTDNASGSWDWSAEETMLLRTETEVNFFGVCGRRLLETTAGRIGLAPELCEVGDALAVLHGCRVPLVLRRVEGEESYRLVGDCFVEGAMNGEAVSWFDCEADEIVLV